MKRSPIDTMASEGKKPDFHETKEIKFKHVNFHYPSRVDVPVS